MNLSSRGRPTAAEVIYRPAPHRLFVRLGITARPDRDDALEVVRRVLAHLDDRSDAVDDVVVEAGCAKRFDETAVQAATLEEMDDLDALVAVGGDGTILYTLQRTTAPLLGVRIGHLGFLAELTPEELAGGLDRVLSGDYFVEERARVATTLAGARQPDATNEAVVKTSRISKMVRLEIFADDERVEQVRADGLIVATPTGSTSYALSAGGPIVDPEMEAMVLVPIAPFKLGSRPVVLPGDKTVRVDLLDEGKPAMLTIDGQHDAEVAYGDDLTFTLSETPARFIRFEASFYRRVREYLVD